MIGPPPVREGDPLPEGGFANGYEASKAAGERLVRASLLRWTIARPSIVVGASIGLGRRFGQRAIYAWSRDALEILDVEEDRCLRLGWALTHAAR